MHTPLADGINDGAVDRLQNRLSGPRIVEIQEHAVQFSRHLPDHSPRFDVDSAFVLAQTVEERDNKRIRKRRNSENVQRQTALPAHQEKEENCVEQSSRFHPLRTVLDKLDDFGHSQLIGRSDQRWMLMYRLTQVTFASRGGKEEPENE